MAPYGHRRYLALGVIALAFARGAVYLVTKGRALLELDGRKGRPLPFRIVAPEALDTALGA